MATVLFFEGFDIWIYCLAAKLTVNFEILANVIRQHFYDSIATATKNLENVLVS